MLGWSFDPNERDREITVAATAADISQTGTTGLANPAAQRIFGIDAECGFELLLDLPSGSHDLVVEATTSAGTALQIARQSVIVP